MKPEYIRGVAELSHPGPFNVLAGKTRIGLETLATAAHEMKQPLDVADIRQFMQIAMPRIMPAGEFYFFVHAKPATTVDPRQAPHWRQGVHTLEYQRPESSTYTVRAHIGGVDSDESIHALQPVPLQQVEAWYRRTPAEEFENVLTIVAEEVYAHG